MPIVITNSETCTTAVTVASKGEGNFRVALPGGWICLGGDWRVGINYAEDNYDATQQTFAVTDFHILGCKNNYIGDCF